MTPSAYAIPWKALPVRAQKLWPASVQETPAAVQDLKSEQIAEV